MKIKEALAQGLRIFHPRKPAKRKPFQDIPLKRRAVYVLYMARFTYQEIGHLLRVSKRTARRWLAIGKEKFPQLKRF